MPLCWRNMGVMKLKNDWTGQALRPDTLGCVCTLSHCSNWRRKVGRKYPLKARQEGIRRRIVSGNQPGFA
jgi:hypothetical protein